MSTHICSNCGHEEHIFGQGGADACARSTAPAARRAAASTSASASSGLGQTPVVADPGRPRRRDLSARSRAALRVKIPSRRKDIDFEVSEHRGVEEHLSA